MQMDKMSWTQQKPATFLLLSSVITTFDDRYFDSFQKAFYMAQLLGFSYKTRWLVFWLCYQKMFLELTSTGEQ